MPALNPPTDPTAQLQWLVDREAILDLVSNFAVSIDEKDQKSYADNFVDDAVLELPFGRFEGKAAIREMPTPPAAWATQHLLGIPVITVDGDNGTARVPCQPTHVFDAADLATNAKVGGFYSHRVVRTPDGWRFAGTKLTLVWTAGEMTPGGDPEPGATALG